MAKLYFNYAAMNAGKSTMLLQASYNYHERGMRTLIFTAAFDDRAGFGRVASRIGLSSDARTFDGNTDIFSEVEALNSKRPSPAFSSMKPTSCPNTMSGSLPVLQTG